MSLRKLIFTEYKGAQPMMKLPDRKQGDFEDGYVWQDELIFSQCDAYLNVKISTLLGHLVTISSQHCRSFGMTYESFLASDTAFVLTRTTLTIHKLPRCFSLLTLQSWVDGIKGPYYQRIVQWLDEENNLMISSRSDWVIIQPSTRTLCKPDKNNPRFTKKSPIIVPPCKRVKFGDLPFTPLGTHQVKWSDLDGNGHLHSAHYGDIIWNFLPESLQKEIPTSFSMEFQKEGCLDDVIEILGTAVDASNYIILGESKGNTYFKTHITF